jgi:hypothetical protein
LVVCGEGGGYVARDKIAFLETLYEVAAVSTGRRVRGVSVVASAPTAPS